ncbi:hypothetical protein Tco_0226388 [Tanacetum coccineum]
MLSGGGGVAVDGDVGYDDDGDGEVQLERRGREKKSVEASGVVGWVDRKKRNTFGVRKKNPPEKFSGGGSEAAVVAGGGAGGGWWWPDIWRGREN